MPPRGGVQHGDLVSERGRKHSPPRKTEPEASHPTRVRDSVKTRVLDSRGPWSLSSSEQSGVWETYRRRKDGFGANHQGKALCLEDPPQEVLATRELFSSCKYLTP